jgi:hypothetical protein
LSDSEFVALAFEIAHDLLFHRANPNQSFSRSRKKIAIKTTIPISHIQCLSGVALSLGLPVNINPITSEINKQRINNVRSVFITLFSLPSKMFSMFRSCIDGVSNMPIQVRAVTIGLMAFLISACGDHTSAPNLEALVEKSSDVIIPIGKFTIQENKCQSAMLEVTSEFINWRNLFGEGKHLKFEESRMVDIGRTDVFPNMVSAHVVQNDGEIFWIVLLPFVEERSGADLQLAIYPYDELKARQPGLPFEFGSPSVEFSLFKCSSETLVGLAAS